MVGLGAIAAFAPQGERLGEVAAYSESSGPPAEKTLPSWTVVTTADKTAGTDVIGSMAKRAGADITKVQDPHLIIISQPQAVTDLILDAVATVG